MITDKEARADIIKNIWLFIPLGAILYRLSPKKRIILFTVLFSVLIEGIQYYTSIGYCELNDIISNSIGGGLGYYIEKVTRDLVQRVNIMNLLFELFKGKREKT